MVVHLRKISLLSTIIAVALCAGLFLNLVRPAFAQEATQDLNSKISDKKQEIDQLQRKIEEFQAKIKSQQAESRNLRNQLSILENQVAKVELDIQATEARIEENNLEIQRLNIEIENKEKEISGQKDRIAEYIRLINTNDGTNYIKILITKPALSEFFDQIQYTKQIHNWLKGSLDEFKTLKADLETQRVTWEERVTKEEELKNQLSQKRSELVERNNAHEILLVQSRFSERDYQNNLYQLQLEQKQINSEIVSLEKQIREALEKKNRSDLFKELGPARLGWPVDPARGITAYFHDKEYPFRNIFEHPAVDVRAPQGTTIKAAEGGFVGRVKFLGNTSYAYIMIIHSDGLSTVYGHISKPLVGEEEIVTKGQAIALSGGMPGGIGSGNLTTGPHLHFEVRLDGIPVDPLNFLP